MDAVCKMSLFFLVSSIGGGLWAVGQTMVAATVFGAVAAAWWFMFAVKAIKTLT